MSVLAEHLVELLTRRRLHFEQTLSRMTTNPLTGKPGYVPKDPYPAGASDEDFSAFCARTGFELPDDVEQWLRITNGAVGYFGIDPAQSGCNIEEIWQVQPYLYQDGWTPVGRDDFGNFYVRVVPESGGRGGVFHVEGTMADQLAYAVASDTLHLAEFVLEQHEALNSGETYNWPFDKSFVLSKDPELCQVEDDRFPWSNES